LSFPRHFRSTGLIPSLEAVAHVSPARSPDGRIGQSAEEQSGMGGPYKSLSDNRVALVVDLEPTVVHEPRPGALDNPPSWEHFKAMVMDLVHDLGGDVVCPA